MVLKWLIPCCDEKSDLYGWQYGVSWLSRRWNGGLRSNGEGVMWFSIGLACMYRKLRRHRTICKLWLHEQYKLMFCMSSV